MILGQRVRCFEHEAGVLEGQGTKILHLPLLGRFAFLLSVHLIVLDALTLEVFELGLELFAILVLLKVRRGICVELPLIGSRELSEGII